MTVVLDYHGATVLAQSRARLEELRRRDRWPAIVPPADLAETLTGEDHPRDFHENRLLAPCDIRPIDEELARSAATRRTKVNARRARSAVDAVVVALADHAGGATVLSSDPGDLRSLARHTTNTVRIGLA